MNVRIASFFSTAALALASCGATAAGDSAPSTHPIMTEPAKLEDATSAFTIEDLGPYAEPWAMDFEPGTGNVLISEKRGKLKLRRADGSVIEVSGGPTVAYGGQGGLGDVAFAPDYAQTKVVYLSWAAQAEGRARRATVGRGTLVCDEASCRIDGLKTIWQQDPPIDSFGHFSHRMAFSPDGKYLFLTSGERMQGTPAQDTGNNLGKVLRLMPDGSAAPGNPFADKGGVSAQIWSYGQRNLAGLAFDADGRLWEIEHGPRGGDEINLVLPGRNYGWPVVSDGNDYSSADIPDHDTRPEFEEPKISWNPVLAPGNMIIYSGALFPDFKGNALVAGLASQQLTRVALTADSASEIGRYGFDARLREIEEAPDGSIWLLTDGPDGKLLRLSPKK